MMLVLYACSGGNVVGEDGVTYAKQIIVYTNQTSGGRGSQLEKMIKEENFPFEVLFVELSGQNLKNRLLNEKNMPFADVVLGGSTAEHIELKNENITASYVPSWSEEVEEKYNDSEGYYNAWALEPLYLVYNSKYYTNDESKVTGSVQLAPKNWNDLATNFKGKYNVFKPSSTSGVIIYASILSQYKDANGVLDVSNDGWNVLGNLINNGIMDAGLWQANLAGNKAPIAMSWAGAVIEVEDAYDVDLEVVIPEEGVPATISQIALVNTSDEGRTNAAKKFIDWWGESETQVKWSKISGQAPTNQSALELVDQRVKDIANVKIMELDWEFIAKNSSKWREHIELEIIG